MFVQKAVINDEFGPAVFFNTVSFVPLSEEKIKEVTDQIIEEFYSDHWFKNLQSPVVEQLEATEENVLSVVNSAVNMIRQEPFRGKDYIRMVQRLMDRELEEFKIISLEFCSRSDFI